MPEARSSDGSGTTNATRLAVGAALSALCVAAFWSVSQHYHGFRVPYGTGVQEIDPAELVYSLWYLVLGVPALIAGIWALDSSSIPRSTISMIRATPPRRWLLALAALCVAMLAMTIRAGVLDFAPVADDESTYVFIARTLLEGRVANPAPGDSEFFRNQFIILNDQSWYGKYPIGHPLLLALGEGVGLRALVPPLLTGATFALIVATGALALGRKQAILVGLLLLISPQFLLTGATELSQVSSGLCLALALWALVRLDAGGGDRLALVAGSALAFGVATRPLPGLLFLAIGALWVVFRFSREPLSRQLRRGVVLALPVLTVGVVMLLVQHAQTGEATTSGYDAFHGGRKGGFLRTDWMAASFWSALLRQNLWLFGWPISFLFLPFARRSPRNALFLGMVIAAYAYRLILPKTVVASTGPIYVAEIVPVLALLSASGMVECAKWLERHNFSRGQERVAATALVATLVASATFLPLHLRELGISSYTWRTAHRMLDEAGAKRSLIFAQRMVDLRQTRTWAYYPPNPSPRFDDERVFVRTPQGAEGPARAYAFWRERFPDREAWLFEWDLGYPRLRQLVAAQVAGESLAQRPPPRPGAR